MSTHPPKRFRATASVLALAALVGGGLSACAEAATSAAEQGPSPESVHLISNNGHELAFQVIPGQSPAIVLDAGGGLDSSEWDTIAPKLAQSTGSMVITYDRAGEGRSDEVPGPWKVEDAVADLQAGLTELGVTQDVVLVSHSLAGEIATEFARTAPGWIAGAVLVDASLPEFYTDDQIDKIVAANSQQIAALQQQPQTRETRQLIAQAVEYGPNHRAYHQMSWPGDVPATAIVSSQTPFDTAEDAQLWKDAQAQFVSAAPNRQLVVADPSSHDIPLDRPDVVITAVENIVDQVR
ncbi:alpha/beta fold hydrolase [Tomitella biformata]|uniref:alpha/beta fold hydrolase n=1 Tax=Tomitella biformata TaxID=630403 RepID=UPI00046677E9|nr:alpha/beta hydrolase [Tomitella biformata]